MLTPMTIELIIFCSCLLCDLQKIPDFLLDISERIDTTGGIDFVFEIRDLLRLLLLATDSILMRLLVRCVFLVVFGSGGGSLAHIFSLFDHIFARYARYSLDKSACLL